jgi:hypothetical protein
MNTQLNSADGLNISNIRFSEPIESSIPPSISYKRVGLTYINDDGSEGELIVSTDELYSYGVGENTNMETGKVNGYVLPLVLHNKSGPTPYQKTFVDVFNKIVERCKDYLMENKEELGQYELERNDLKKLNPLYYKKDKGKIVEGSSPTLYAKLIVKKDKKDGNKIITVFFDRDSGDTMDALELLGKHCYARAAIKFESIFIGNKISLQIKLYECEVKIVNNGMKRLLSRPLDDDAGSLIDDDIVDDDPPVENTIKEVPKKVVKKVVKKIVK